MKHGCKDANPHKSNTGNWTSSLLGWQHRPWCDFCVHQVAWHRQVPDTATLFWRRREFSHMDISCVVPVCLRVREQSLAHFIYWYNVVWYPIREARNCAGNPQCSLNEMGTGMCHTNDMWPVPHHPVLQCLFLFLFFVSQVFLFLVLYPNSGLLLAWPLHGLCMSGTGSQWEKGRDGNGADNHYNALGDLCIILSYSPAALGPPPPCPVKSIHTVHALFLKEAENMCVH